MRAIPLLSLTSLAALAALGGAGCSAEPERTGSGEAAVLPAAVEEEGVVTDPGSPDRCPDAPATMWRPRQAPSATAEGLKERVTTVQREMVGHWRGRMKEPWADPREVLLSFEPDGTYTSRCLDSADRSCIALGIGTDRDTHLKKIRLASSTPQGLVSGEIDVAFAHGEVFDLPTWQGVVKELELDASRHRLRFEHSHEGGYGPIKLDLWRCVMPAPAAAPAAQE